MAMPVYGTAKAISYIGGGYLTVNGRAEAGPKALLDRSIRLNVSFDMIERMYAMMQEIKERDAKQAEKLAKQNAENDPESC
jgi:hypothetical protein